MGTQYKRAQRQRVKKIQVNPTEVYKYYFSKPSKIMGFLVNQILENNEQTKCSEKYRNYSDTNELHSRVYETYNLMHTNQTVEFVKDQRKKWLNFKLGKYTIMEVVDKLENFVDTSDPDVDFSNMYHAFQTAEGIRKVYPDKDWLIFAGFIHDLGKIMSLNGQPQWATVGDTYVVGCKPGDTIVYSDTTFVNNVDTKNPEYNTKLGMYKENCGFENLMLSFGHDEYLYNMLVHNNCNLPKEALYIIRYHSFYPWHTGKDGKTDYEFFENESDKELKKWILEFNKFDLYCKCEVLPDIEKLTPYYVGLCEKFAPGKLEW